MLLVGLLWLVLLMYVCLLAGGQEVGTRMRVLTTLVLVGMLSFGAAAIHVVRSGDTLGRIAAANRTSVAALAAANGLADPDRIYVGQRLTIPDGAAPPSGAAPGRPPSHVVDPGDTLLSIARRYGIDPAVLVAANGIVGERLYRGARLRLAPLTAPDGRILTGPRGGATYVVRSGDNLARIAAAHRTTVAAIVVANGLADPNRIRIGQRLTVGGGAFRCPIERPVRFINDWGFPRGGGRAHEGTDLFADRGTPVVAPVAGVVKQSTGPVGGLQVRLIGDDGNVYLATHLHTFGAGGRVGAGTVIGTVGTSGSAAGTPAHLHFEIHPGGVGPVNPFPSILEACRAA